MATCEMPGCEQEAVFRAHNLRGKLVCREHWKASIEMEPPDMYPQLKWVDEDIKQTMIDRWGPDPFCWYTQDLVMFQMCRCLRELTAEVRGLKGKAEIEKAESGNKYDV